MKKLFQNLKKVFVISILEGIIKKISYERRN